MAVAAFLLDVYCVGVNDVILRVDEAGEIERLMGEGPDRHEAAHAVGSVLAMHIMDMLKDGRPNNEAYYEEVEWLTAESWRKKFGPEAEGE